MDHSPLMLFWYKQGSLIHSCYYKVFTAAVINFSISVLSNKLVYRFCLTSLIPIWILFVICHWLSIYLHCRWTWCHSKESLHKMGQQTFDQGKWPTSLKLLSISCVCVCVDHFFSSLFSLYHFQLLWPILTINFLFTNQLVCLHIVEHQHWRVWQVCTILLTVNLKLTKKKLTWLSFFIKSYTQIHVCFNECDCYVNQSIN